MRGGDTRSVNPPQISSNPVLRHRYRFRAASAQTEYAISARNAVLAAGAVCSSANATLSAIAMAVRIRAIHIWAGAATAGTPVTASVKFAPIVNVGSNFGNIEISDTTMSTAIPAVVHAKTDKNTAAHVWNGPDAGGSIILAWLSFPAGAIVDVEAEWVLADDVAATNLAVASAAAGVMYYPPLDGGSDVLLPVSLITTT